MISGYKVLAQTDYSEGVKVKLEVTLPRMDSGVAAERIKIIFSDVILSPNQGNSGIDAFPNVLKKRLLELSTGWKNAVTLNRQNTEVIEKELNLLRQGQSPVTELAKLGNRLGGDLIVTTEVDEFNREKRSQQVGTQVIERVTYNVVVSYKVLEVATGRQIDALRIRLRNKRYKAIDDDKVADEVASRIVTRISRNVLKDDHKPSATGNSELARKVDTAAKRSDERIKTLREKIKNDW